MRRLFIAINLPEEIKREIARIITQINANEISIRWLPPENWHLTISFLGYQLDEAISPIIESLKETVKNFSAPLMEFEKIIYGPPNKSPRMIWLAGTKETSKILSEIKNKLEDELIKNRVQFKKDNRGFNCHLTLARFLETRINTDLKQIDTDIIRINQYLNQHKSAFAFYAKSFDLMESHLKRTGAEYEILASLTFSEK